MTDVTKKCETVILLDELTELTRKELIDRWQVHFKNKPPKGISRELLVRTIAYRIQVKAFGGLKPSVARQLTSLANNQVKPDAARSSIATGRLAPGSRLLRQWNDEIHHVDVTEDGYRWNGLIYKSLSAVARDITGARWSGPRFFGLTSKAVAAS